MEWDYWFQQAPELFYDGVGPAVTSDFYHKYKEYAGLMTVSYTHLDVYKRQVHLFILITLPAAHDRVRMQDAVIGGKEAIHALPYSQCRDEMGQNL